MFTGIIEHFGTIESLSWRKEGGHVTVHAPTLTVSLAVSGSIAVNGCCLTIVDCDKKSFSADLSAETLAKTSFNNLEKGVRVNLEQPLTAGKEFGGHFVLGHVDGTGSVASLEPEGEGWRYSISVPMEIAKYIVPKGSITIDGVSLTVARWQNKIAEIAVIPFTYEHTNICDRKCGDIVNIEGDVLGKYVERYLQARNGESHTEVVNLPNLIAHGF